MNISPPIPQKSVRAPLLGIDKDHPENRHDPPTNFHKYYSGSILLRATSVGNNRRSVTFSNYRHCSRSCLTLPLAEVALKPLYAGTGAVEMIRLSQNKEVFTHLSHLTMVILNLF